MKYRMRIAAIASAVLGVLAAAAAGYAAAQTGPSGPTKLQPPYVARDRSGDPVMTVQLQTGVGNTGQFYFTVAGAGVWAGVIGIQPAGHSPVVHLRGDVTAHFTANDSNKPVPVTVRIEGTVNTAHHSATINVWAAQPGKPGPTHYLINTNPPPNVKKAGAATRAAASALQARDWGKLYKMASSEITTRYTQAQFVSLLDSQHQPQVRNLTPSGTGSVSMNDGLTYFTQKFAFIAVQGGKTIHYTADIIVVWENKAWRFTGTTAPTA